VRTALEIAAFSKEKETQRNDAFEYPAFVPLIGYF